MIRINQIIFMLAFIIFVLPALSFAGSVDLPQTGQTTCYDVDGNVIECTGTGQDGDIQAGVEWPQPRFADNGDGTVTDNLTGLIWLKNANCAGTRTWNNALSFCNNLSSGSCGLTDGSVAGDWRLPNRKELLSLVDYSRYLPALLAPFYNVQSWNYWSATTTGTGGSGLALIVRIGYGVVTSYYKSDNMHIWPVRAGQGGSFDFFDPLKGTVTEKGTSTPIASATVDVGAYSTNTDNFGHYSFSDLDPGAYSFTVSKSGYHTYEVQVAVVEGGKVKNVDLVPDTGKPAITSVEARYDEGIFLDGLSADNTYTVGVAWDGNPGTVKFTLNGAEYIEPGDATGASHTFDMGFDFVGSIYPDGNTLEITAMNEGGAESDPVVLYTRL